MDASEEVINQTVTDWRVPLTAVSEEEFDEDRRRNTLKHLYGSNEISLPLTKECPQRPAPCGCLIIQCKAAEHYMNGKEAVSTFQYERAVMCFSRAITLQPQQVKLHVSGAEAYLQLCDFQSAAVCYKQASLLEPGSFSARLAFVYYLQGQCLFEQGLPLEALEAFSKAAEVQPSCRAYKVKSLACLAAAGHQSESLKLVNEWMALECPTADLYILRARLQKQLNQTSQCYQDVKSALVMTPVCAEAKALLLQLKEARDQARQQAVDRALSSQLTEALKMMNIALENSPQDAHLYLFRGILYRCVKDFSAAIEDLVQALELSEEGQEQSQVEAREEKDSIQKKAQFQLVLTYNDFAVQCFIRGLYAEATLLLNKAIEEEKDQAGLYLNRGDCFFKQADWNYALADYEQAKELMHSNNPVVRLRLAVVYNTMGSFLLQDGHFQEAADLFSLAIQYNPTAPHYYESRSKAFRKLQNLEGARKDLICLLILDSTNEEVLPMLMNMYPGCSVSAVLSSPKGHAVRVQLMDAIQACNSSTDSQRMSEEFQKKSLNKKEKTRKTQNRATSIKGAKAVC